MRLGLEGLEARENPSRLLYWDPQTADHSANTAANWHVGSFTGPRANAVGQPMWVAPGSDDHLYFVSNNTAGCVISIAAVAGGDEGGPPPSSVGSFAGVHLLSGYTGTVDFHESAYVGTFELASGTVAQSDPTQIALGYGGGQISVTSTFTWTGGNLNSGSNCPYLGYFNLLPGAVGTATPTADAATVDGAVDVGSTITLLGDDTTQTGSTLTLGEGSYTFNSQVDLEVKGWSHLKINAPVLPPGKRPDGKIELTQNGEKKDLTQSAKENGVVVVDTKAVCTIDTGGARNYSNRLLAPVEFNGVVPKVTNYGTLAISDYVKVQFIPSTGETGAGGGLVQKLWPVGNGTFIGNQKFSIEAGCEIECQGSTSVDLDGFGDFNLTERTNAEGVPLAEQDEIVITAMGAAKGLYVHRNITMKHVNGNAAIPVYIKGTFYCDGWIEMYAGRDTVTRYGQSDLIKVKKQVVFGLNAEIDVSWLAGGSGSAVGNTWTLMYSEFEDLIDHKAAINREPAYTLPSESSVSPVYFYRNLDNTKLLMDCPSA